MEILKILTATVTEMMETSETDREELIELNRKLLTQLHRVMQENIRLKKENEELKKHIFVDALTGTYNRHFMDVYVKTEIEKCKRYEKPFSVIMLDIDFFKKVNDTYGHLKGDEVLRTVARIVKDVVRKSDIVFRYGGEEFLIVLPETDLAGAEITAKRIKEAVENHVFEGIDWQVTVSLGVAEYRGEQSFDELIEKADSALYRAKRNGRNQVQIAA